MIIKPVVSHFRLQLHSIISLIISLFPNDLFIYFIIFDYNTFYSGKVHTLSIAFFDNPSPYSSESVFPCF